MAYPNEYLKTFRTRAFVNKLSTVKDSKRDWEFDKIGGPIPVIAPAGDILIGDSIYTERAADSCSNVVDNSENVGVSIQIV